MRSTTIEYQRFGDSVGLLRRSDAYLRTVDGGPTEEVRFELDQARLRSAMARFDYKLLSSSAQRDAVLENAQKTLDTLRELLAAFLPLDRPEPLPEGARWQVEIVTRALELSQLPFEALEADHPGLVLTRRVRLPRPRPVVHRAPSPRVLFAWAEPRKGANTPRRWEVPHAQHRALLEEVLAEFLDADEGVLVELPNATLQGLRDAFADPNHGITHLHLLAHGLPAGAEHFDPLIPWDLEAPPPPPMHLALEGADGVVDRIAPVELASLWPGDVPRPASAAFATCHSGELDPVQGGGTLAHVAQSAGVPVVLASQLALTQAGSDELITTFLAGLLRGQDPREALRATREVLAGRDDTWYDRFALVGYVQLEPGFEESHTDLQLRAALQRLRALSKAAERAAANLAADTDHSRLWATLTAIRTLLDDLADRACSPSQEAERRGLLASSLKREAEAWYRLEQASEGAQADEARTRGREALEEMRTAYRRAANLSRDDHWTWTQSLACELLATGSGERRARDWVTAWSAASDAVEKGTEQACPAGLVNAAWAHGSLAELALLGPSHGQPEGEAEALQHLDELRRLSDALGAPYLVESTARQLARYATWWGQLPATRLPSQVTETARRLYDHLTRPTQ